MSSPFSVSLSSRHQTALDAFPARLLRSTALIGSLCLGLWPGSPALASAAGLVCESSHSTAACTLGIAPGLTLESTVNNIEESNSQEFRIEGTVTVVTPVARVPLSNTDLTVRLGAQTEIIGSADLPHRQIPLLQDAAFQNIPRATVALANADTITELLEESPPLNSAADDKGKKRDTNLPYLLFHVQDTLSFDLDMPEALSSLHAVTFTTPGSMTATAILDPFDPYMYLSLTNNGGIDLNKLNRRSTDEHGRAVYDVRDDETREVLLQFTLDRTSGTLTELNNVTGTRVHYKQRQDGRFIEQNAMGVPAELDSSRFDTADADMPTANRSGNGVSHSSTRADFLTLPIDAIAYSHHGWIPYTAQDTGDIPEDVATFSGQLYLRGEIPLHKAVTLKGDVVTYLGEHGFAQGGNGTVTLGIPGLSDLFDVSLELANASAAITAKDTAQKVFVSGEMNSGIPLLADILPMQSTGKARVEGYVGNDLENTFLSIKGEMNLGADALGQSIGVPLQNLQLSKAQMIIDRHGVEVSGTTRMQITPDIALSSDASVYAAFSWDNPDDISISIKGNMNLFGVAMNNVSLEASAQGVMVNGVFVTPFSRIALDGRITAAGPQLSGNSSLTLDLGDISTAMQAAHRDLTAAQAEVNKINNDIANMRATVNQERQRDQNRLSAAQRDLAKAKQDVNKLDASIAAEHRAIKHHQDKIAASYRWYQQGAWWQKAPRWVAYSAEKVWRTADIGRHYVQIAALKVAQEVAKLALDAAALVVKGIADTIVVIPVDADPRVAALFIARDTANLALEAAKLPFANIPYIDFSVSADLAVSLGVSGLSGSASAKINGANVLSAELSFKPVPKVCVTLPVFGDACTPF